MKLEKSFSQFLKNTVNLNETRVKVANFGITTMTDFLKANETFGNLFISTNPQGSFRQETIIKPVKDHHEFDVDLLFIMKVVEGWSPEDYLINLAKEFKKTDRYKDKVDTRGKNRCVTIDYESDFHIDIVTAIKTKDGYLIMNKKTNQFEQTDGDGYAIWFEGQNAITGKKHLTKVVRLFKFIRDSKESFEAKSILLTTLLGSQIQPTDNAAILYPDLPTSFITLITKLDNFLQLNSTMPSVSNPVLSNETFNRHWNQEKYSKFRDKIHEYTSIAVDAFNETDESKSVLKWQKIFGEKFTSDTEKEQPASNIPDKDYSTPFVPKKPWCNL